MTIILAFEITIEDKEQQPIFLIHEFSKKNSSFSIKNNLKTYWINFRKCHKIVYKSTVCRRLNLSFFVKIFTYFCM